MGARVPPPSTRPPWGKGRQDASACSQGLKLVPLPLPLGRRGARSCPWAHTRARHTCTGWALPHSWRLRGRICFASSPDSVSPTRPLWAPPAARQLWSCRCTSSSRLPRPVPPAPSPACPSPPSPSCSPLPCSPPPLVATPRWWACTPLTPCPLPARLGGPWAVGSGAPRGACPPAPQAPSAARPVLRGGEDPGTAAHGDPRSSGTAAAAARPSEFSVFRPRPLNLGSPAPLPPASLAGRPRPGAPVSP